MQASARNEEISSEPPATLAEQVWLWSGPVLLVVLVVGGVSWAGRKSLLSGSSIDGSQSGTLRVAAANAGGESSEAAFAADPESRQSGGEVAGIDVSEGNAKPGRRFVGTFKMADGAEGIVSVQLADWETVQGVVASQQGHVVVLDLWATSCVPCRREFPALVRIHEESGGRVVCISHSMDYSGRASRPPESYGERVLSFLVDQRATFANYLGTDDPDELHRSLDLAAIPAVYVYDQQGRLRRRFDNTDPDRDEFTYEADVTPFVRELLKGK